MVDRSLGPLDVLRLLPKQTALSSVHAAGTGGRPVPHGIWNMSCRNHRSLRSGPEEALLPVSARQTLHKKLIDGNSPQPPRATAGQVMFAPPSLSPSLRLSLSWLFPRASRGLFVLVHPSIHHQSSSPLWCSISVDLKRATNRAASTCHRLCIVVPYPKSWDATVSLSCSKIDEGREGGGGG